MGIEERDASVALSIAVTVLKITAPSNTLLVALTLAWMAGVGVAPVQIMLAIPLAVLASLMILGLLGAISMYASTAPTIIAFGAPIELLPILVAVDVIPDMLRTVAPPMTWSSRPSLPERIGLKRIMGQIERDGVGARCGHRSATCLQGQKSRHRHFIGEPSVARRCQILEQVNGGWRRGCVDRLGSAYQVSSGGGRCSARVTVSVPALAPALIVPMAAAQATTHVFSSGTYAGPATLSAVDVLTANMLIQVVLHAGGQVQMVEIMWRSRAYRRACLWGLLLGGAAMPSGAGAVAYFWDSGTFSPGSNGPRTLTASNSLTMRTTSTKTLTGTYLNQGGTVEWQAGALLLSSGATFTNAATMRITGTTQAQSVGTFINGATGVLTVSGALSVTSAFTNAGTIDVTNTGSITLSGSTAKTFDAGTLFTGVGTTTIQSPATFNGAVGLNNVRLDGVSFTGNGATLSGTVTLLKGTIQGSWTVGGAPNVGTLNIQGTGVKAIAGTFVNRGTVSVSGSGLSLDSGASVTNSGIWSQSATDGLVVGGGITFSNNGMLTFSGGTGPSGSGTFTNPGTLRFTGTSPSSIGLTSWTNSGTVDVGAGGLTISSVSTFNGGTMFTGSGITTITGQGNFSGAVGLNRVSLSGAAAGTNFTGNAATMSGIASLLAGNLAGTWTVGSGGTLKIDGTGTKAITGTLVNNGQVSVGPNSLVGTVAGTRLTNNGLWDFTFPGGWASSPSLGVFVNNGTLRFTGYSSSKPVSFSTLTNNGTIQVVGGVVEIAGNATFNGGTAFTGSNGGKVWLVGTTFAFNGAIGSDNVEFAGGAYVGSNAVLGGTTALPGGRAGFGGGSFSGNWTLASGATLEATYGNGKSISGTFRNDGTFILGQNMALIGGTTFTNYGRFVGDGGLLSPNGPLTNVLINTATGEIYNPTSPLIINTSFRNEGGLLTAIGVITLSNASTTFLNGTRIVGGANGAGGVQVTGGATFSGTTTSTNAGLILAGGTYTGTMAVLQGAARWTGGTMAGGWTLDTGSTVAVTGTAVKAIGASGVISNKGTIAFAGGSTQSLTLATGATLTNEGRISLADAVSIVGGTGAGGTLTNSGLIEKTAGTGTATFGSTLALTNTGTIDVRAGTIALPATFTNTGTLMGTGTFSTSGTLTNNGIVAPGASGAIGTLTFTGGYAQGAAGLMDIQLGANQTSDLVAVTGAATLGGNLVLSCTVCTFSDGDAFRILSATNGLTGSFAYVDARALGLPIDYAVRMRYDFTDGNAYVTIIKYVFALPESSTWAMMIAGFGLIGGVLRRDRRAAPA